MHQGPQIIVAEDDPAIRTLLMRIVPRVLPGAAVLAATSGEEALELYLVHGADLLITDHLMGGLSGIDLALAVRAGHPNLPVLIVSATAGSPVALRPDRATRFVPKPFKVEAIEAAIAALLPRRSTGTY